MSRRAQIVVLAVLLGVLIWVLFGRGRPSQLGSVLFANEKFEPLGVADPTLRLDRLERVHSLEYTGSHRNIFRASLPPKPQPAPPPAPPKIEPAPPPPPVEPPLQIPFKFYGFAADPQTGRRRGFFTDGENVWIVAEGETIQNRFRLLRIGARTADLEELQSGRRASIPLEEIAAP